MPSPAPFGKEDIILAVKIEELIIVMKVNNPLSP
tara:strand:+ start:450 stop:551 length:102 start_codon:yes stop_codon:yes gene_type:complete